MRSKPAIFHADRGPDDAPANDRAAGGPARRLIQVIAPAIQGMYPGYFALVMATGILSNAWFFMGAKAISQALFLVNVIAYGTLLASFSSRLAFYRRELWHDLCNPRLVFAFFTFVAATNILGVQFFLRGYWIVPLSLWLVALCAWVLLAYFSFSVLAFINTERSADVVHGGWLIGIVGTQSVVWLGTLLAHRLGALEVPAMLAAYSLWGIGVVLYGIFMTLFSYRVFFVRLVASDMGPLFWVIMGAAAISTNAGISLASSGLPLSFFMAIRPFIEGTTLVLWAWSTWLTPLLVAFGVWRHLIRGEPLAYEPGYWSLVFPLGMYTVATYRFAGLTGLAFLRAISGITVWVALGAWCVVMIGLIRMLARGAAGAGASA